MAYATTAPTSNTGARPIVAWSSPVASSTGRWARATGSIVGLAIAAAHVLLTLDWSRPPALDALGEMELATIAAGTIGGWIFGRSAWGARTDRDWLSLILGFAVSAVVIGAATVGLIGGLSAWSSAGPGQGLGATIGLVALALLFGVPTIGLFILPITLAAAGIWALVMVVLRPLDGRTGE